MSFADKLAQRASEKNVSPKEEIDDGSENMELFEPSPFFGVEHVRNQPSCLDLRLSNGFSKALPYAYFVEINYDPSDGIEIITTTRKVIITGRNMKQLYGFLVAYRLKYIKANVGFDITEEGKLFVKNISVEDVED